MCDNICTAHSKVGDYMEKIKQLLYKYLDKDSINLIGMQQKTEDLQWMVKNGYQEDFERVFKGARTLKDILKMQACSKGGAITEKGKKFIKEYNKEFDRLCEKTKKVLTYENEQKTASAIKKYVYEHKEMDFSINSKLLSELTENERYAFDYFLQNPLDSGKR